MGITAGAQASGVRAGRFSLRFPAAPGLGAVDVAINGHRVFSATPEPPRDGLARLSWPAVVRPYLRGTGTVRVTASATGELVAQGRIALGRSSAPIAIVDGQGRQLTVNKWQRLGLMISDDDTGLRERLLSRTDRLIEDLTGLGCTVYITGGTLLGAVRRGDILPHDDDVDLAVFLDDEHPSDLGLASYRLEDELVALGYTVVRHSTAHLQVTFLHEDGRTDHYIDIFTAFYRGAEFCQPFHVRSEVPRGSIVPVRPMAVAGRDWPAPAVPEEWLAACYGEGWAVPDPSFRFVTPLTTRRRFENWFGSQNIHRVYWEGRYAAREAEPATRGQARFTRALSRILPAGEPVLDLGCGTGAVAAVAAEHGHEVIATDYSYRALELARRARGGSVDWRYGNLNDRRRLLELAAELVRDGRRWNVLLSDVLHGLTEEGRGNVLLLLRQVLRRGGFALASFDTDFVTRSFRGDDPQTWHLPVERLRSEAERWGVRVEPLETYRHAADHGRRRGALVVLTTMEA